MTISNHPVLILTCKHLKERRRRLFHTIWEITSGVLVFVMLLLMRQVIKHSHFTQDRGDVSGTRLNEIIYTPNNKLMQTFMTKVANNFGQRHARTNSALVPFKGFPNEAAVDDYMASLSSVNGSNPIAVVSFKDVNTTLPNLDYTIKLVDKADLKLYRPKLKQIPIYEPLNTKEQASFPLMKLQWAIDRTFMERVTGVNISHRVSIPHFRSNSDTKTPIAIIHQFLIFCTVAAPLPFFLYNSSRLVNERRSGLKELMKIVGVTLNEVRLSHVMATAVLSTIYASLITMMLKAQCI
ncbi:uncharacterized protein [Choristoneura fumiferana]|uniref:uncharacterized protein n=1 Tax=Choristoneura fumiferana TaxID=7141 RepID=UPI003D156F48